MDLLRVKAPVCEMLLYPTAGCGCCSRDALKLAASVFSGALLFPFLVWGGYVFLPFDAPLLETAPLRLVYTLRCSVFGVVPIVLGEQLKTTGQTRSVTRLVFSSWVTHSQGGICVITLLLFVFKK